jgi:UDP-2,3-diacylglucosamine pyrophosphatase LpxH
MINKSETIAKLIQDMAAAMEVDAMMLYGDMQEALESNLTEEEHKGVFQFLEYLNIKEV